MSVSLAPIERDALDWQHGFLAYLESNLALYRSELFRPDGTVTNKDTERLFLEASQQKAELSTLSHAALFRKYLEQNQLDPVFTASLIQSARQLGTEQR